MAAQGPRGIAGLQRLCAVAVLSERRNRSNIVHRDTHNSIGVRVQWHLITSATGPGRSFSSPRHSKLCLQLVGPCIPRPGDGRWRNNQWRGNSSQYSCCTGARPRQDWNLQPRSLFSRMHDASGGAAHSCWCSHPKSLLLHRVCHALAVRCRP